MGFPLDPALMGNAPQMVPRGDSPSSTQQFLQQQRMAAGVAPQSDLLSPEASGKRASETYDIPAKRPRMQGLIGCLHEATGHGCRCETAYNATEIQCEGRG